MPTVIAPLRCRRPTYVLKTGYPAPGDWETSDPRFRLNGNRKRGWTIMRNGLEAVRFLHEYGLKDARFSTRREALQALHSYLQFDAELPAEQQTINPVRPAIEGYDERSQQEVNEHVELCMELAKQGKQHPLDPYL